MNDKKIIADVPKYSSIEEWDKAEGWLVLRKFKNKAALAAFANDPNEIADLEFKYPIATWRRKLDLDNKYLAVLRR
jgi:hypothetical protein